MISIHAPREGGDGVSDGGRCRPWHFNPRPPRGGRPLGGRLRQGTKKISIHAPREGGDRRCSDAPDDFERISIHAPREGGDIDLSDIKQNKLGISIHAPREGGDVIRAIYFAIPVISIHAPREGGDPQRSQLPHVKSWHFNPRPPRGGRLRHLLRPPDHRRISIHAPREGGDPIS